MISELEQKDLGRMADEWVSAHIGDNPEKAGSARTYLRVYSPCSLAQRTECMKGNRLPLPARITEMGDKTGGERYLVFWKMLRDRVDELCLHLRVVI